ncbi:MAG: alkaline phosphatase family protein [Gemmatimonadales bacterium]
MSSHSISRRDFLAQMAIATATGMVGCTDSSGPSPDPGPTLGTLDHIVIVTMENRSFDHLLGWLPGADGRQAGLSYADRNGVSHPTYHLTRFDGCGLASPKHTFEGGRTEYNNGACDGWLTTEGNDLHAIGYYEAADMPFLGKAAPQWRVLDKYFCPMMGPTVPNRIIAVAGQTDRLANSLVVSTLPTIWDRLSTVGLTSGNYGTALVTASLWGGRYSSIIKPITSFFSDAAAGQLPNVSFVDPVLTDDVTNSYHPPGDIRDAEAFLGSIYKAVTKSPLWKKSLLIVTFDEWGGFYDHVPPTAAPIPQGERDIGNTDGLRGFRIPTILISPFVKRASISSKVYDHSSVLRLIETRWNLQALTVRDANANNLMDEIDLTLPVTAAPVIDVPQGPFGTGCV